MDFLAGGPMIPDLQLPPLPPSASYELRQLHQAANDRFRRIEEFLAEIASQASATVTPVSRTTRIIQQTSIFRRIQVTLTENYSVPIPTDVANGQIIIYKFIQTGSFTVSWPAAFGNPGQVGTEPNTFSTFAFDKVSDQRLELMFWQKTNEPITQEAT